MQNCLGNIQNVTIGESEMFEDIEIKFWANLENLLKTSFSDCAVHISQCLQQDLPKLMASARALQSKFGTKFVFR